MKSLLYTLLSACLVLPASVMLTSCSDDDFTDTIFDPTEYPLDKTKATFPLDTFIKKNFLEQYNLRYVYKMEDIGSDMQKNLVPCKYENSVKLAVLSKYLWYEVYEKLAGNEFLKQYSPRIIHVIGSPSYNPTSGSETLGEAEGGLKITLYNANNLDETHLDNLNEKFFKTMHHEFSHILHQNYVYPTAFSEISNGRYNPMEWEKAYEQVSLSTGFISNYASSQAREDWVEVISNYIVMDEDTWNNKLDNAHYEWETHIVNAKRYEALVNGGRYFPDPSDKSIYIDFAKNPNMDSVGYRTYKNDVTDANSGRVTDYEVIRKVIERDGDDNPITEEGQMQYVFDRDGIDGRAVILRKLEMGRTWLKDFFKISIDDVRKEVQTRQFVTNPDGTFKRDDNGMFINRITSPMHEGSTETLMDSLLNEVYKFKELQK